MIRKLCVSLLLLAGAVQALCQQAREQDVVYGHKEGVALSMDVFKPAEPNGIGVIWLVSGGWVSNHNQINPALAQPFTAKGITVFQVVHGSQPRFKVPEIIGDVRRAVRFIRANAARWKVDPERLGISGGSAGGHLSLWLAATAAPGNPEAADLVERQPAKVAAVAVFYPPTDFSNWGKDGVAAFEVPMLKVFWPAFGVNDATPKDNLAKLATDISPYSFLSANMPPTLLIHGDADVLVPIQQSQRLAARLKELGVTHELVTHAGKAHGWPDMGPDILRMLAWYEKHLAKKG